jgi:hypothetical protein
LTGYVETVYIRQYVVDRNGLVEQHRSGGVRVTQREKVYSDWSRCVNPRLYILGIENDG